MKPFVRTSWCVVLTGIALAVPVVPGCAQGTDQTLYDDAPQNGWDNWSWAKTDLKNAQPARGAASVSVVAAPYSAFYFQHKAFDSSPFEALSFWIHGGEAGGQKLRVVGLRGGGKPASEFVLPALTAGTWTQVNVPLDKIGVANVADFDGFHIQDTEGREQPVFYLDDLRLIASGNTKPAEAPQAAPVVPVARPSVPSVPVTVRVNALAKGTRIDPRIYGVNLMEGDIAAQLSELNAPINRWGGNASSRYNWKINASNRANDWFYESVPEATDTPGGAADYFIGQTHAAKAESMMTIPLIGWVGKLGPNREKLASFSVSKYGAQQRTDAQYFPDAGNGVNTEGKFIKNDINDANVKVDAAYMAEWVKHLKTKWGAGKEGGVRYLLLDNEAGLWHETHRDVVPHAPTMKQMRDLMIEYATMIRGVDLTAKIVGPEEWGWNGYLYSPSDLQYTGERKDWSKFPDREANGGQDYIPFLLSEFKAHEKRTKTRVLDVLTVHYYPQGGVHSDDVSDEMQLKRNRSTRSLWDETYKDESWINNTIGLMPRLKKWARASDPTLELGVTEYDFGAERHINGAIAQADVLGIFGREGLHIATRWVAPKRDTPVWNAMKLLRNYDGKLGAFGDRSLPTSAPNPDDVSAFSAVRSSDGALTVLVINKQLRKSAALNLDIAGFKGAQAAQYWQLTATNRIKRGKDVSLSATRLKATLPPQSLNLFVIAQAGK